MTSRLGSAARAIARFIAVNVLPSPGTALVTITRLRVMAPVSGFAVIGINLRLRERNSLYVTVFVFSGKVIREAVSFAVSSRTGWAFLSCNGSTTSARIEGAGVAWI